MRKFSATIPYNCDNTFTFEEHPYVYSLEQSLQLKSGAAIAAASSGAGSKTETAASSSGKINLFENQLTLDYFIANRMFYSNKTILDLNAENIPTGSKFQVGI